MIQSLLPIVAALAQAAAAQSAGRGPADAPPSPTAIAEAAPAEAWRRIAAQDLLVMDLSPDGGGRPRRVVIQLAPAPLSAPHVANIRTLATAHWWDGTTINRVQDNYVAQWGDATEKKPLPPGLPKIPESAYDTAWAALRTGAVPGSTQGRNVAADVYAPGIVYYEGFALGTDMAASAERKVWPVHCYATVGVGRDVSPDTGSGAELYAVIGHAPRHLDRNVAVVGRVVAGIEYLSALPRGTAPMGFYADPSQRVAIRTIRLASDLPVAERPAFEYLATDSAAFQRYAHARRNRELPFFFKPAGAADVCNIPVPVRAVK